MPDRRVIVLGSLAAAVLAAIPAGLAGCRTTPFDAARATRAYPMPLHTTDTADIQVFRDGRWLEVVNSTAHSYEHFDLWVNQRYMRHVDAMHAGSTVRLSLGEFYDERGEAPVAGGFFRTRRATPVRLVQIQPGPIDGQDQPLVGLITIRAEPAE